MTQIALHGAAPLHRVAEAAKGSDARVAQLAEESAAQRLTGMRALAGMLHAKRALRRGLTVDEAADILWLLNDPSVYHRLVIERGWTEKRYTNLLTETLITQLLPGDSKSAETSDGRGQIRS